MAIKNVSVEVAIAINADAATGLSHSKLAKKDGISEWAVLRVLSPGAPCLQRRKGTRAMREAAMAARKSERWTPQSTETTPTPPKPTPPDDGCDSDGYPLAHKPAKESYPYKPPRTERADVVADVIPADPDYDRFKRAAERWQAQQDERRGGLPATY